MIDLYAWPTPNSYKISIMLAETALPFTTHPINIGAGDQFKPEFLAISPNNRMPAIVDHEPADGGGPLSVFESGAILTYLGEKTGRFYPSALRERVAVDEWVFWQVGGLGPMAGQLGHFINYSKEKIPYAIERYRNEVKRLLMVMERRLSKTEYLGGAEYSIADMMSYPWAVVHERFEIALDETPGVARWLKAVGERPAVVEGMAFMKESRRTQPMTDAEREVLYGKAQMEKR